MHLVQPLVCAFAAWTYNGSSQFRHSRKQLTSSASSASAASAINNHGNTRVFAPVISASIAATILLAPGTAAFGVETTANLAHGKELFQANCAGCHAGGANFISEQKTLRKEALIKYRSLEQPKLQDFVQNGMQHRFLPFKFQDTQDYFDVTSFVLDQALNDKW